MTQQVKAEVYLEELQELVREKEFLDPLVELTSFSLSYYPDLATELLKKTKDLPDHLFQKIVDGIRKEQWPSELYDSLANFSENERLR